MDTAARRRPIPRVEVGPAGEFVFTDIDVEPLAGGLMRVLFFCEQRPMDFELGPESRLRTCGVTASSLLPALLRKLQFALEHVSADFDSTPKPPCGIMS